MTVQDVLVVQALLREHLKAFHLSPVLTLEDVKHWLLPQDGVIDTYVVEVSMMKRTFQLLFRHLAVMCCINVCMVICLYAEHGRYSN